jgi:hypothetical protein
VVHPHHAFVAGDQAVLHPVGLAGIVDSDLFGEHPLPVFGMQHPEPVFLVDHLRARGITEHGLVL